ncbi:MAG: class I SAM-dependent methyltransferase [Candidatus Sungiibacteriota bacterium]
MQTILNLLLKFFSEREKRILDFALHTDALRHKDSADHADYLYWESQVDFWRHYPSPIRPSTGDLKIYSDFLGTGKTDGNILILGSTPELRDLAAQTHAANIWIADFSYLMPSEMLKFTKYVDPFNEKWIKCDWLELPFPELFFNVILGDLVLQQIRPAQESGFLRKIASLLKKDGVFVGRMNFLDDDLRKDSIDNIVETSLRLPFTFWQRFVRLKLKILWLCADPKTRSLNRQLSFEKFSEFLARTEIRNGALDAVKKDLARHKDSFRNWCSPYEQGLTSMLSRYFELSEKKAADDYEHARYYPIYLLKRR